MTEHEQIIKMAFGELNKKYRILAPAAEAKIQYPDFDPCKAIQAIARVYWPATVNMVEVILCHTINDGDILY